MTMQINFSVNGIEQTFTGDPTRRLLDVIRQDLRLTGAKEGCGEGECGACAVIVDGLLVNSCLMPVLQARGCQIQTIEAAEDEALGKRLQQAFIKNGGTQCGICTPGMVLAARQLLVDHPNPSRAEVRRALSGNLCRCTGYQKIIDSVMHCAKSAQEASKSGEQS